MKKREKREGRKEGKIGEGENEAIKRGTTHYIIYVHTRH